MLPPVVVVAPLLSFLPVRGSLWFVVLRRAGGKRGRGPPLPAAWLLFRLLLRFAQACEARLGLAEEYL